MDDLLTNRNELEKPMTLRRFVTVLYKRKRFIVIFFSTIVILVAALDFILPSVYQSSAKLLVEPGIDSEKAILLGVDFDSESDKQEMVNSEIEIIKSDPIAASVVKALHLYLPRGAREMASDTLEGLAQRIEEFKKKLKVANVAKSNVLMVSYEAPEGKLAAEVVRKVIDTYLNYRTKLYDETKAYQFFEEQANLAGEQLRAMEQHQAEFKQEREMLSPEVQKEILLARLGDYERSLTAVRMKRIGKEAKLGVIKRQMRSSKNVNIPSTETSDSPSREKYIAKLKGELLDLEIQRDRLLQKFTPQYQEVVHLEGQITATKEKITAEIQQIVDMEETSIRALRAEERALLASISKTRNDIKAYAGSEYEFAQHSRGIENKREVYSMLLKQQEEARISSARLEKETRIKIISPATIPFEPIRPRKKLDLALAIVFGLCGGLGLAFLFEHFDHTIDTPEELAYMNLSVLLGSVRLAEELKRNGHLQESSKERVLLKRLD